MPNEGVAANAAAGVKNMSRRKYTSNKFAYDCSGSQEDDITGVVVLQPPR